MKKNFFYNPASLLALAFFLFFAYSAAKAATVYFSMAGEWDKTSALNAAAKKSKQKTNFAVFKKISNKASAVYIKGDFNGWEQENLSKNKDGSWEIEKHLEPGKYSYVYVVDGEEQLEDLSTDFTLKDGRKVSFIEIK